MSHEQNGGKYSERKNNNTRGSNDASKRKMHYSGTNTSIIDSNMIGETVNHKLGDIFSNSGD